MNTSRYLAALRRWALLVIVVVVAAGLAAWFSQSLWERGYSATATARIGTVKPDTGSGVYDVDYSERLANTYRALAQQPEALERMRQQVLRETGVRMDRDPSVEVRIPANTELIDVTVRAPTPEAAAAGANAVAAALVRSVIRWSATQSEPVPVEADVVMSAQPPGSPAGPDPALVLAGALLGGLLVGLQLVAVAEKLDGRLWDPATVAARARLPLLGELEARRRQPDEVEPALLRIAIDLGRTGCAALVVGSASREDVSPVAVGLATAFALQGNEVLLIDSTEGDEEQPAGGVVATGSPRLSVLRTSTPVVWPDSATDGGSSPDSLADAWSGEGFTMTVVHVAEALRPAAALAARSADTSLLVVVLGRSTAGDVAECARQLASAGPVAGVLTVTQKWLKRAAGTDGLTAGPDGTTVAGPASEAPRIRRRPGPTPAAEHVRGSTAGLRPSALLREEPP